MQDNSLPSSEWANSLPADRIVAALSEIAVKQSEIAAKQSALAAIQSRLAARLLQSEDRPAAGPASELIDARALATRLGVHESFVRTAARAGKIPSIRIGRYVRFEPAAVIEALADCKGRQ